MIRKIIPLAVILGITAFGCQQMKEQTNQVHYLVTKLGSDTLAIEKIEQVGDSIIAEVLLRSPKTSLLSFGFSENSSDNVMLRSLSTDLLSEEVTRTEIVSRTDDSISVSINKGEREESIAENTSILPFVDMVHWPFEIMLRSTYMANQSDPVIQEVWSGTRTFNFELMRLTADSMTIKHPSRGTMGVTVNEKGELIELDAGQTTRKLTVTRVESLDFDGLKAHFVAVEKSGKSFGALSGRGAVDKTVNRIAFSLDFGTPAKRGRDIWGTLVPYGERWRTGANRATHFSCDKDIMLGDLSVPAGEYTFFSIPEEEFLTLIVNKQTGQNGRTYDEAQDLGRVNLSAKSLDNSVELFTIDVLEGANNPVLSIQWGNRAYEVEITQ